MKLKSLQYYLDEREELLELVLQVMEPERLLLSPTDWLSSIALVKWSPLNKGFYPSGLSYLHISADLSRIVYYDSSANSTYVAPVGDYRKLMEHLYQIVSTKLN